MNKGESLFTDELIKKAMEISSTPSIYTTWLAGLSGITSGGAWHATYRVLWAHWEGTRLYLDRIERQLCDCPNHPESWLHTDEKNGQQYIETERA